MTTDIDGGAVTDRFDQIEAIDALRGSMPDAWSPSTTRRLSTCGLRGTRRWRRPRSSRPW